MKWIDYRRKLGIGFDDKQKFDALKNKLINFIDLLSQGPTFAYTRYDLLLFLTAIGERIDDGCDDELFEVRLILENAVSIKDLISKYIEFCNCYNFTHKDNPNEMMFDILIKFMNDLALPFGIKSGSLGKYVFPKGVPELDEALVSDVCGWLKEYPASEKAWSKALREYAESNSQNASDVADLFRKALETFFKEFFHTDKSLENCKSEYGSYLKQKGVPKELAGNFETMLQSYTNFMNEYAKHRDATSNTILEYIMYQTGNIIRLLLTL